MDLIFKERPLNPVELRFLNKRRKSLERNGQSGLKLHYSLMAAVAGAVFLYLTLLIKADFWRFIFSTGAVISFYCIIYIPYEAYKMRRKNKGTLQGIIGLISRGSIQTCRIEATRFALAQEYEDESDLYIIELEKDKVLYVWDNNFDLDKKFPCADFEIYDEEAAEIFEKDVRPLSPRVKPIEISPQVKWKFMGDPGFGSHLEVQHISFDHLMSQIEDCAKMMTFLAR